MPIMTMTYASTSHLASLAIRSTTALYIYIHIHTESYPPCFYFYVQCSYRCIVYLLSALHTHWTSEYPSCPIRTLDPSPARARGEKRGPSCCGGLRNVSFHAACDGRVEAMHAAFLENPVRWSERTDDARGHCALSGAVDMHAKRREHGGWLRRQRLAGWPQ